MKDKVLFWLDYSLIHFGIVKSIQEKLGGDFELSAIIDVNPKPKKFFQNQTFVKFDKMWFLRDNVLPNKKPNLNYLSDFEKKYGINLWSVAYTERIFLKYFDYYQFEEDEILSILEQECRFYEKVLSEMKPDFLCIRNPDWHHLHLLLEICKSKGIKILMLFPTRIKGKTMIVEEQNKMDQFVKHTNEIKYNFRTFEDSQAYHNKFNRSKTTREGFKKLYSKQKFAKSYFEFFFTPGNKEYRQFYINYGRTKSSVLLKETSNVLKNKFRQQFINRNFAKKVDYSAPFVYFPLHFEPESSLLITAPYFTNQIEVIKNIAKSIPINFRLYVKEHPAMQKRWRNTSYYKQILKYPNVKLIHPFVPSEELIKNCKIVISISGTSAMEASFYNKPSIVFSSFWGSELLSSVHKLNNLEELPNLIKHCLYEEVKLDELNNFVNVLEENSIGVDILSMLFDIWNEFYFGGAMVNVDIPFDKFNSFLEHFSSDFKVLAKEHIKKINQHKQYTSTK